MVQDLALDNGSALPAAGAPQGRPAAAQEPVTTVRRNSGSVGCWGGGKFVDSDEVSTPSVVPASLDSASDSEPVMPPGLVGMLNLGKYVIKAQWVKQCYTVETMKACS